MASPVRCVLFVAAAAVAFDMTAAYSKRLPGHYSPDVNEKCFNTTNLKLWPVKPETHVCGPDGLLYPSNDALECSYYGRRTSPVTVEPRENCKAGAKPYDPCLLYFDTEVKVCGTDNVTHTHLFEMACTASKYKIEIDVQSFGECKVDCPRSFIYKPVCSSDNETFANEEAFKCKQILMPYSKLELKHVGVCSNFFIIDPCDPNYRRVGDNYYDKRDVCASNGRTFFKPREVRCLKKTEPSLEILHEGACTVQEVENIVGLDNVCNTAIETDMKTPICGSNNVTYNDTFTFLCASKSSPNDNKLTMAYEGECFATEKCPNPPAPRYPSLVCGSDGISYKHVNDFICAQLKNTTLKNVDTDICFDRTEKDFCFSRRGNALDSYYQTEQACGTDRVTYVTKQDLLCAAKTKPEIQLHHFGACL